MSRLFLTGCALSGAATRGHGSPFTAPPRPTPGQAARSLWPLRVDCLMGTKGSAVGGIRRHWNGDGSAEAVSPEGLASCLPHAPAALGTRSADETEASLRRDSVAGST